MSSNKLWSVPDGFDPNATHDGYGGACRSRPDLIPKYTAHLKAIEERGVSYAPVEAKVPVFNDNGALSAWKTKLITGNERSQIHRDRYLYDMACGKLPQRGFKSGLEPTGAIYNVDPETRAKDVYFMPDGTEVRSHEPVEGAWEVLSGLEYAYMKASTCHNLAAPTERETAKRRNMLRGRPPTEGLDKDKPKHSIEEIEEQLRRYK